MGMCFGKPIKNNDHDRTNNFCLAMAPMAGNGETLCYSCHDIDENGICGKNVDGSSPLMAKAVCKKGCQVRGYHWISILSSKYIY